MNYRADAEQRHQVYQRLVMRNRIVALLRIAVPLLGVAALAVLIGQIYLASLGSRFGIGQISVTRDSIIVDAPEYAGLLADGTAYRVSATAAQAATDRTDQIALSDAMLTMTRPDGLVTEIDAQAAVLDTTNELVVIDQTAHVANSEGTSGTVADSVFDYKTQTLEGDGAVAIDYADGTKLVAQGLTYDAKAMVWTFRRATVTLPDTPGARTREMDAP